MSNIANNITELIGKTPLVRLNRASEICGANIIAKCEFMNPTSSIKDSAAFNMIKDALQEGRIKEGCVVIEPTSGNTGVALAAICSSLKIELILTMPESMSIERRKLLSFFGAKLVLTPAKDGMSGAIKKADELNKEIKNSIILGQFTNPANPQIHELTTAKEILADTDAKVDAFVAAVGTGGTLSGTAKTLKKEIQNIAIFAVEPASSAVLSGCAAAPHAIQGIGAGFIPKILDTSVYQEIIQVSNEDAIKTAKALALDEGLLVGISSGANVYAAMQVGKREELKGKNIVTILCDTGERYLSTDLFSE